MKAIIIESAVTSCEQRMEIKTCTPIVAFVFTEAIIVENTTLKIVIKYFVHQVASKQAKLEWEGDTHKYCLRLRRCV